MVNSSSSSCKNYMYLIRLLVLDGLINNRRVFVEHIRTEKKYFTGCIESPPIQAVQENGPANEHSSPLHL